MGVSVYLFQINFKIISLKGELITSYAPNNILFN